MSEKIFLSIIVATIGREVELENFLNSIEKIEDKDAIEVIIVDQNEDMRLVPIVNRFQNQLNIKHLKYNEKHANKARNYGASCALGEWFGFADDDCAYHLHTISELKKTISEQQPQIIVGAVVDIEGQLFGRSAKKQATLTKWTILGKVFETNMYIEKDIFNQIGGFSNKFGPGSPYFSEEGLELILRAGLSGFSRKKVKIYYNEVIAVTHPRSNGNRNIISEKIYHYSIGTGAVLAKYLSIWSLIMLIGFAIVHIKKRILYKGFEKELAVIRFRGIMMGFTTYLKRKRKL